MLILYCNLPTSYSASSGAAGDNQTKQLGCLSLLFLTAQLFYDIVLINNFILADD